MFVATLLIFVRLLIPAGEEDQPGWNCHTMGNHICGPAR